jgi:hypothetical protein
MAPQHLVNSFGLVCDIIGAILIWHYGLPDPIDRGGAQSVITENKDEAEIAKARRYDCIAKVGICLLVLGFVLQLTSNFL